MRGQSAAREFEIKLEIPAPTVSKVMRLPWLWELATGELRASRMQSVYYDTPRYTLRERGVTLRVRRVGGNCVQTIKAAVNGAALPIERNEWEEEIAGDEPVLALAAGTPLKDLSRKKLRRRLQPCFEVHVDRSAFPIESANSAIEVAIDRAHIVGAVSTSFCEIELELKRGASSEMARIARRIASEVPAALSLRTKAERGFVLRQGEPPQPHYADRVSLAASTRVGEAFQMIGWACLRHIALNKDAVEAVDVVGVHQMRAGVQRLCAAISLFARLLDGPETDAIKSELQWLAAELDPVCAFDVFLARTLLPLAELEADPTALRALAGETTERLKEALARAKDAVTSDRCRQLVLRTGLWLIAAEWSDQANLTHAQPSRRIGAFAAQALRSCTKRALKRLGAFERLDEDGRADLHRSLENLQSALDFFASLFPDQRRHQRKFLSLFHHVLRDLGWLNDFAAQRRFRDRFMEAWTGEEGRADANTALKALAMGYVLGQQASEEQVRRAAVLKAGRRLVAGI